MEQRDRKTALLRGLRRKCPKCGEGRLFSGYLKVNDECPSCGEDFSSQRADDGPAWATMIVTGHLMAPILIFIYENWSPSPVTVALVASFLIVWLSLILLPRIKGAFIAIQWATYMYGFGQNDEKMKTEPDYSHGSDDKP